MALAIVGEIRGVAPAPPAPRGRSGRGVNPSAYLEYLRGRYHWRRLTQSGVRKALEHFHAAIAIDPACAPAHAGLATCHAGLAWTGATAPGPSLQRSRAAALHALALDDTLAEAHTNLGYVAMNEWDWALAERHLTRGVALDPASSDALLFHVFLLTALRRHDEAIETLLRAQRLDPLSPLVAANLGYQAYLARRYPFARTWCEDARSLDPTFEMMHWVSGIVCTGEGRFTEAVAELERAAAVSAGTVVLGWLGFAYARAGRLDAARGVLARLEGTAPEWTSRLPEIARVYVGLGQPARALDAIEEACALRAMGLQYLAVDPSLDEIRTDPRYEAAVRQMGLPS
jgi:serine/threonine-protein kinase